MATIGLVVLAAAFPIGFIYFALGFALGFYWAIATLILGAMAFAGWIYLLVSAALSD